MVKPIFSGASKPGAPSSSSEAVSYTHLDVYKRQPNNVHASISIDCLRAGKNVLCEKPAARTYSEALEMQKAQHETGKILNIGVVNRFNDHVNLMNKLIDSGELGEIYHEMCIRDRGYSPRTRSQVLRYCSAAASPLQWAKSCTPSRQACRTSCSTSPSWQTG